MAPPLHDVIPERFLMFCDRAWKSPIHFVRYHTIIAGSEQISTLNSDEMKSQVLSRKLDTVFDESSAMGNRQETARDAATASRWPGRRGWRRPPLWPAVPGRQRCQADAITA